MPDLGKAVYTLVLNTTSFDKGLADAEARAAAATNGIAGSVARAEGAIEGMGGSSAEAAREVGVATEQMEMDFREVGAAAQTSAGQVEASAGRTGAAGRRMSAAGAAAANGWNRASQAITGMGNRVTTASRRMGSVGREIRQHITLPVVAIGAVATKMAYDFNESFHEIEALVGASTADMHLYKESVLALSGEVAKAPKELADALYFVTSAGFSGASAIRVLDAAARASAAGLGDTSIVADAVTSAVNAYGEAALSAEVATDVLLATVREGKAEPEELAASIGRVIPVAEAMGVTFHEVGGQLASMTLAGLDSAEATTALRGIMTTFLKPSLDAEKALKKYGMTMEGLRAEVREGGLMPVLVKLRDTLSETDEAAVFNNVRALAGFLNLTGANVKKNEAIVKSLNGALGDTDRALAKVTATDEFKLRKALNDLRLAAIRLGQMLIPTAVKVMDAIAGVVEAFNGLSESTKKTILIVAGLAALIGPIIGLLATLGLGIGALTASFAVFSAVSAPILAVAAAVVILGGAMAAAVLMPDQLAAGLEKLGLSAEQAEAVVIGLRVAFEAFKTIVEPVVRRTLLTAQHALRMIGNALNILIGILTLDFARAWNGIKGIVSDSLTYTKDLVMTFVNQIKGLFQQAWDALKVSAYNVVLDILEPFSKLPGMLGRWARDAKESVEGSLEKIEARQAAERARKNFRDVFVPGMNQAGVAGKTAVESQIGSISTGPAIKKATDGMVREFGVAGTMSGDLYGKNLVAAMDPWFIAGAQNAETVFDQMAGRVEETLNGLGNQMAGAAARGAKLTERQFVFIAGKWRDATGKVVKDAKTLAAIQQGMLAKGKGPIKPSPGMKVTIPGSGGTGTGTGTGTDTGGSDTFLMPIRFEEAETLAERRGPRALRGVLADEQKYLEDLLRNFTGTRAKRLAINQKLTEVMGEIKAIDADIADTVSSPTTDKDVLPMRLQLREQSARNSGNLKRLDAALEAEETYLRNLLKKQGLSKARRLKIKEELGRVIRDQKTLTKEIEDKANEPTVLTFMTPQMRLRRTRADRTEGMSDNIRSLREEDARLRNMLSNRKKLNLTLEQVADIEERRTEILADIKSKLEDTGKQATETATAGQHVLSIMGERAGFFGSFGSNIFHDGMLGRMPGSGSRRPSGRAIAEAAAAAAGRGSTGHPMARTAGAMGAFERAASAAQSAAAGTAANGRVAAGMDASTVDKATGRRSGAGAAGAALLTAGATKMSAHVVRIQADKVVLEGAERGVQGATGARRGVVVEKMDVNQDLRGAATADRNREARLAYLAVRGQFDTGSGFEAT